jgi:hypothetical protein
MFVHVMCGGGFRELSKTKTTFAPILCDLCESTAVGADSLQLLCSQFKYDYSYASAGCSYT